jgi:hypothetical protein
MPSFVRRRVTYANLAMTLALVLAMSGGAFAAGKFLITSTKQISPKVLKSLQGKAGPAGAGGAQGPVGPQGPAGPQGPVGVAGAPGAKGETGVDGKEGKAGKDGKAGLPGSPWAAGGTLPSGSSETGVWAFGETMQPETSVIVPVASFPIELAAPMSAASHGHYINSQGLEVNFEEEEVHSTACKGTAVEPTAEPGNLCIYALFVQRMPPSSIGNSEISPTIHRTGAFLTIFAKEAKASGNGTWAVTAE